MRGSLLLFVAGLLVASAVIFCSDPVSNKPEIELIPLKAGNFWEFDVCTTYADGSVSDTIMDVLVIDEDTVINDTTWYASYWTGDEKVGTYGLWANLSGGLWLKTMDTSILWIKYPSQEGEITDVPSAIGANFYIETVLTDTVIDVRAGQYSCHMFREMFYYSIPEPDTMISTELFYRPGVGPVQYSIFTYDRGGPEPIKTIELRLIAYHLE